MMTITQKRTNQGFGLVELMISITLGLLLTAAVLQTFIAANTSYRIQDSLSQIQEAGRYTLHFLGQDLRMAGYMGCASIDTVPINILSSNPPDDVKNMGTATAVVGQNNVAAGNTLDAVPGSDTIKIRRASSTSAQLTGNLAAENANIKILGNDIGLQAGDYVFITDCLNADLFTATSVSNSAGEVTIAHANNVNIDNKLSKAYGADAEIFAFETVDYFIRDTGRTTTNGNPVRALYVQRRSAGSGGAAPTAYELVEGVEDLQITYGEDTNDDANIDRYVDAANVADWSEVLSVRLELLLIGDDDNVVHSTGSDLAQVVEFNGENIVNNDGRYRRALTNVFAIRNKLP